MEEKDARELLKKYTSGQATDEEKAILESWYLGHTPDQAPMLSDEDREGDLNEVWLMLEAGYVNKKPARIGKINRWSIAASVLLLISAGAYYIFSRNTANSQIAQAQKLDIPPGNSKAILHLANGRQIYLAANTNRSIQQANANINASNGQLTYQELNLTGVDRPMVYDTIVIPRGGQQRLLLADGSRVWINAASALRFPEGFYTKERQVELLYGEAYFEVVHDADKPFRVATANQVIEDIGTHFNVNAYQDESNIKTTLLEGSVKITRAGSSLLLKPGEQSLVNAQSSAIKVQQTDLDEAIAWKNNKFIFNNEDLGSIMRKISRWYDVDISYQGGVSGNEFMGSVSRFKSVSEVLRKLEETGTVHFNITERRITVMP